MTKKLTFVVLAAVVLVALVGCLPKINKPPKIVDVVLSDTAVYEGETFTVAATVSDPDGLEDVDYVSFTFAGETYKVTSPTDGVFVAEITAPDEPGKYVLTVKARDKYGHESDEVTKNVEVLNLIEPVVKEVKALGTLREGQEITVAASVTSDHPNNTTATITVDGEPKTAMRTVTGAISVYEATFTLKEVEEDEVVKISAKAYDEVNGRYSEEVYDYITIDANDTPVATITLDATSVKEYETFTVTVELADKDGDEPFGTITYAGKEYGPLYDDDATVLTAVYGATEVSFVFTDGYKPDPKSDSVATEITVEKDEFPGYIEAATVSEVATAGETIDVTWKATDDDDVVVEVVFESPDVTLEKATSSELEDSVSVTVPGTLTVDTTVTVTIKLYVANGGLVDSFSATPITVIGNDYPEVYVTPTTFEATENTVIKFTVKATDTIGGLATLTLISDTVDFAATEMAFDGDETITGTLTGFEGAVSTPLSITVKVEDGLGVCSTETLVGTILDYNKAPTITVTPVSTHVAEGGVVSFTVNATDANGLGSIKWELLDASDTVVDSDTLKATVSQTATFTAPAVSEVTNYIFKVTVTDAKTGHPVSSTAEATVVVHNKPDIEILSVNPEDGVPEDDRVTVVVRVTDDTTVTAVNVSLEDVEGGVGTVDSSETTGLNSSDTVVATFVIKAPVSAKDADLDATITVVATGDETGMDPISNATTVSYTVLNSTVPVIEINSIDVYEDYTLRVSNTTFLPHRSGKNYKAKFNLSIQSIAPGAGQLKLVLLDASGKTEKFADYLDLVEFDGSYYAYWKIPTSAASDGVYTLKIEMKGDSAVYDKLAEPVIIYDADEPATADYVFSTYSTNSEGTTTLYATTTFTATITGIFEAPEFTIGEDLSAGTITVIGTDTTHPGTVGEYYVGKVKFEKLIDTTDIDADEGLYTLLFKLPFERPKLSGTGTETAYVKASEAVVVDNQKPVLKVEGLTNVGTSATLTFTLSDLGITDLAFKVADANGTNRVASEVSSPTPTMKVVKLIDLTGWPQADLWNATVTLIATDAAGHVATKVVCDKQYQLDTKLATIVDFSDYFNDADHEITVNIADDLSGIDEATVIISDSTPSAVATITLSTDKKSATIKVSTDTYIAVTVKATDARDNFDSTETIVATFDTIEPTITATSVSGVATESKNSTLVVVSATDLGNVNTFATLTFEVNDPETTGATYIKLSTNAATLTGASLTNWVATADRRTLTISIEAKDFAGNTSDSITATVEFDNKFGEFESEDATRASVTTGEIDFVAGATGLITSATGIVVDFELTDYSTVIDAVATVVDSSNDPTGAIVTSSIDDATVVTFTASIDLNDVDPGNYTLILTATDSVGNSATYGFVITLDDGKPQATISNVATTGELVATITATDLSLDEVYYELEVAGADSSDGTLIPDATVATAALHFDVKTDVAYATLTLIATDVLDQTTVTTWKGTIDTAVGTFVWQTDPNMAQPEVNIAASNSELEFTLVATDLSGDASIVVKPIGDIVSPNATYNTTTGIATLTVTFGATQSTDVTLTVIATDANNNVATQTWEFTLDTQRPDIYAVAFNSKDDYVLITFDEDASVTDAASRVVELYLSDTGSKLAEATGANVTQYSSDQIKVDFSGIYDIQADATYKVVVKADTVQDDLGNLNVDVSATGTALAFTPSR